MKVLITNMFLRNYSGSELFTLELAELFEERGFKVTIATFFVSDPLRIHLKSTWNIINLSNQDLQEFEFDLIIAQHHTVSELLFAKYDISYRRLVVSKLSALEYNYIEELPSFTEHVDLISFVSDNTYELTKNSYAASISHFIFRNSAKGLEFDNAPDRVNLPKYPRRVAIVSNHAPSDILALRHMDAPFDINHFGMGGDMQKLVTGQILSNYDLVITIGRTVQLCMACKVPVYVYDRYGGPGYITEENIELSERRNYCGKGFSKQSSEFLLDDIIHGYEAATNRVEWLYEIAIERYNYSIQFARFLAAINLENAEWKKADFFMSYEKRKTIHEVMAYLFYYKHDTIAKEYSALNDENAKLKRSNSQLKKEIAKLKNSRSWKITAPLRHLFSYFKKQKK